MWQALEGLTKSQKFQLYIYIYIYIFLYITKDNISINTIFQVLSKRLMQCY